MANGGEAPRTGFERSAAFAMLWDALPPSLADPDEVAKRVAPVLHRLLGGLVAVLLADVDDPTRVRVAAAEHDLPEVADQLRSAPAFRLEHLGPEGLFARSVRAGEPLLVEQPWPEEPPWYLPWAREHPLASLLIVPMLADGRVLGWVAVGSHDARRRFHPLEVEFVDRAGRRMASSLLAAQLIAADRADARRSTIAAEVGRRCERVLDEPGELLQVAAEAAAEQLAASCLLWLVDVPTGEHLGRMAISHSDSGIAELLRHGLQDSRPRPGGLLATVLANGRMQVTDGEIATLIAAHARLAAHREHLGPLGSIYGVRLDARGRPVGMLVVATPTRLHRRDRAVVDAVAERVAAALDIAGLLAAARAAQKQQRALVEHSSDLLLLLDRDGTVRFASPLVAAAAPDGRLSDLVEHLVPQDRSVARRAWQAVLASPGVHPAVELRARAPNASMRALEIVANNLLDDPDVDGVVLTVHDVTRERAARNRLAEHADQQSVLAAISSAAVALPPGELHQVAVDGVAEALGGDVIVGLLRRDGEHWRVLATNRRELPPGYRVTTEPGSGLELLLRTREAVVVDDYRRRDVVDEPRAVHEFGVLSGAVVPVLTGGEVWGVLAAHSRLVRRFSEVERDLLRTAAGVVAAAAERDVTAERVAHQAAHDALTGLANRTQLHSRLQQMLQTRGRARVMLLLLDLDDFKDVNDSLGHGTGDRLLAQLGDRLRGELGSLPQALVARLGGDEFGVCVVEPDHYADLPVIAERLLSTVREPFRLPGATVTLSASVGVALAPDHGDRPEPLLQAADMAMYRAKAERVGWAVYDDKLDSQRAHRLALLGDLRSALTGDDELVLHYQPIVGLHDGGVLEAEALLRWQHPTRGLLLPDAFVPLAEQTDLIHPLTTYVVAQASRQVTQWRRQGWQGTVSVNISAVNLRRPAVVSELERALVAADGGLTVEITESALVDQRARDAIERLTRRGIRCSIDDFGTGYSSLAYLQSLPVSRVKLDRGLNANVDTNSREAAVVEAIVRLADAIGLDVVAEGVETREIAAALRKLGVRSAQGWLFGAAAPPELGPEEWAIQDLNL